MEKQGFHFCPYLQSSETAFNSNILHGAKLLLFKKKKVSFIMALPTALHAMLWGTGNKMYRFIKMDFN